MALSLAFCGIGLSACDDGPDTGLDASLDAAGTDTDGSVGDAGTSDSGTPPGPVTPDDFSPIAQAAIDALSAFPAQRYSGWNYSADAVLPENWVLQTPVANTWGQPGADLALHDDCPGDQAGCHPDFELQECANQDDCTGGGICRPVAATVTMPGGTPVSLCTNHSDQFVDDVYNLIASAEEFVDLMTLSPFTGRFEVGIRNAMTYLDNSERDVQVRVLMGIVAPTDLMVNPDEIVASITRDVDGGSLVRVSVAAYRIGALSWNHAKIIAVDGQRMIQGGHNLWDPHYLSYDPVHDLSMRIDGETAADGHRFANHVWQFVCEGDEGALGNIKIESYPGTGPMCPPSYTPANGGQDQSGLRVVTLGRFGDPALGENPADTAIIAAIDAAQTVLRFSLQDLGPFKIAGISFDDWPEPVLGALARAMARDVDVYIVFNTNDSRPAGLGRDAAYGTGWETEETGQAIIGWLDDNPDVVPSGTTAHDLVCEKLNLTTLRFAPGEDTWPSGANIANHAKFFIIDDQVFYMGSQNLYQSQLAEFSLLVDDVAATQTVIDEYWTPLWTQSSRVAISGAGVTCTY